MARLKVRDRAQREFEIDETALPFWEQLVEVLDRIPDPGDEPEVHDAEAVGLQSEESGESATPPITLKASPKTNKIEDK